MAIDKQKELLLELWRCGLRQADGVAIPCGTESNAKRFRFTMYNAVKAIRDGKESADAELHEALINCSVGFADGDKTTVLVRQKVMAGMMQTVQAAVAAAGGTTGGKSTEELGLEESAQALAKRLAGEAPAAPRNPYY